MTTTNSEITWTTDDLPLERIKRFFGDYWVDTLLAKDGGEWFCYSRARGALDANERELCAMYKSLAKIIHAVKGDRMTTYEVDFISKNGQRRP